ncbi:hypothetical protein OAB85_02170 [Pseudomonadales bacterium]|nr:hypothetical protein [Pseudomonadales bacterium]
MPVTVTSEAQAPPVGCKKIQDCHELMVKQLSTHPYILLEIAQPAVRTSTQRLSKSACLKKALASE